jgi:hypothetical protein
MEKGYKKSEESQIERDKKREEIKRYCKAIL